MRLASLLVVLIFHLTVVGGAFAAKPKPLPPSGEAEQVRLASALAEYAMGEKDALGLATAAKMLRSLSARVLQRGEKGKDGKAMNPDALLQKARELAKKDKNLLAIIDQVEKTKSGGKSIYFQNCYYRWQCYSFYCSYRYICY